MYHFLGDQLVESENSDEEEIKEQKKEFKVLQKQEINQIGGRKRSSAISYMDFNWEKLLLHLRGLLKKKIKGCIIEKPYILSPHGSLKVIWDLLCLGLAMNEMIINTGIFEDGLLKMCNNKGLCLILVLG